ncbi:MAG: methyltransferase domain-containing protein [Vicinamibacterales bacterium]
MAGRIDFDGLAGHYDWMEAVTAGSLLQRARTVALPGLAGRRRVLSAGEGHGRFAAAFGAAFPSAALTCVDASARMLARARRRAERAGVEATWIHARLPGWRPEPGRFDAIATCFFLDCFPPEELDTIIGVLAEGATDTAAWLVVDFALPGRGLARWRARAMHAVMYAFFRKVTALPATHLTPPDRYLAARGFRLHRRHTFSWGLLHADLWLRGA